MDDDVLLLSVVTGDDELLVLPWRGYPGPIDNAAWQSLASLDELIHARFSILGHLADQSGPSATVEDLGPGWQMSEPGVHGRRQEGQDIARYRFQRRCVPDDRARHEGQGEGAGPTDRSSPGKSTWTWTISTARSWLRGDCPELAFIIEGTFIGTSAHTVFKDLSCTAIAEGTKLKVKGALQPQGMLLAASVKRD